MTSCLSQGCSTSIERLCRIAGVSRAGYYRFWRKSAPRQHDTMVRDKIHHLALANGRHRGYRLITWQLHNQEGLIVNHKRVLRLMRQDNLLCLRKRGFVPATTDSKHRWPVVPNLAGTMLLSGLDQLWVADITYIRLQQEFAYLAVILDAFSRKVIGWAIADHLQASLAVEALEMAIAARRPRPYSLTHHSDRGVQYACSEYSELLAAYRITASMRPRRQPLRQRQGGALHAHAQDRAGRRHALSRQGARRCRYRPLHRAGLQCPAPAYGARLPQPRPVRGASSRRALAPLQACRCGAWRRRHCGTVRLRMTTVRQPRLQRARAALREPGASRRPRPPSADCRHNLTRLGGCDIHDNGNPVRCLAVSPMGCTAGGGDSISRNFHCFR